MSNLVKNGYLDVSKSQLRKFNSYIERICPPKKHNIASYNILFVCDATFLQKKMSRVRFWAIEHLGNHENVNLSITGPGFMSFSKRKSLQQNILDLNSNFDLVIWYKPLNENYRFDKNMQLPFKTCLRYNEMWDLEWTRKEIDETKTDLIISHHKNDYLLYKDLYKNNNSPKFVYIPHFAEPTIFKPLNIKKDIDILISGVLKDKHYPFKSRLFKLIMKNKNTLLSKYNIYHHNHPNYLHEDSYDNTNQINYNEIINRSKLCVSCTSKYNYRLGKYVEIPMAGSVIFGDLPFEYNQFKDFVIEVNNSMNDTEILNILINTLETPSIIESKQNIGLEWSKFNTSTIYVNNLLKTIHTNKIFIIADEISINHQEFKNQKWICDVLKEEFMLRFPNDVTDDAKCADIIWYLAPWNSRFTPKGFKRDEWLSYLKTKFVVCSQHHIDPEKYEKKMLDDQFKFMKEYGSLFHAICEYTEYDMKKYFDNSKIICKNLWINNDIFYHIPDKQKLRDKYKFSKTAHLIGSFQKDTEGQTNLPKLSKGPDIFVNIIKDMYKTNKNVEVVLSGLRREYIINELKKCGIKYHYFNMISMEKMNELYNCIDLYIVSSRCEGGPRSVFEAGLTKTPIISTCVGISPELMDYSSLFEYNDWTTYIDAVPNTDFLYDSVNKLSTNTLYMEEFKQSVFYNIELLEDNYMTHNDTNTNAVTDIKVNKKTVIIGTTAVNRPKLHSDNIPEWYEYINKLDKTKYDIQWFINIDYIEKLNETIHSTSENFQDIITEIPITILDKEHQDGDFLQACKRVSSNMEKYVLDNKLNPDDVIVIWLEDDWKLNIFNIPLTDLIDNYLSNLSYINLNFIRLNYIHALAPCVLNYNLWSKLHLAAWTEQTEHIDPEHCVGLYFQKRYGKYSNLRNITVINKYKNVNEKFFDQNLFKSEHSYYCYDVEKRNLIKNTKYIKKNDVQSFIKDQMTFIRITTSSCINGCNYGREFMANNYQLTKNKDAVCLYKDKK